MKRKWNNILTERQKVVPRLVSFSLPGESSCGHRRIVSLFPVPKQRNGSGTDNIQWSPRLCRFSRWTSANSASSKSEIAVNRCISFAVQPSRTPVLSLPAPDLPVHFRQLCAGAVRRGGRRFGLVSSQSASTAAAGWGSLQRSIPSHWCRGEKRWPLVSYEEWHCITCCHIPVIIEIFVCLQQGFLMEIQKKGKIRVTKNCIKMANLTYYNIKFRLYIWAHTYWLFTSLNEE